MPLPDVYKLSKAFEKKVCRGIDRYYVYFGCTPFLGGMTRGFTSGCAFRCNFCLSPFRDFLWGERRFIIPSVHKEVIKTKGYYSPEEVIHIMVENGRIQKKDEMAMFDGVMPKKTKYPYMDVGYADICIGKSHLLGLCKAASKTDYIFVIETNGFLLGYESDYVSALEPYKNHILVRIGVKAASEEMYAKIVGIKGAGEFVFRGIQRLVEAGIKTHVAMMCDPRVYPVEEKILMEKKIRDAGYSGRIVEEKIYTYYPAYTRFVESGWDPYLLSNRGKLEIIGKRIPGTYLLERYDGKHLLSRTSSKESSEDSNIRINQIHLNHSSNQKLKNLNHYFLSMFDKFNPKKAKRLKLIIEYDIEDYPGVLWQFNISMGKCTLKMEKALKPNLRYVMDFKTAYECYVKKSIDYLKCFYEGRLKIEGNPNLSFLISEIFNSSNKPYKRSI